jgi:hypothetical protein
MEATLAGMSETAPITPLPIQADAVYDDGVLILALGITHATLARARKSGELRFTRKGKRALYLGRWVLEWMHAPACGTTLPKGVSRG